MRRTWLAVLPLALLLASCGASPTAAPSHHHKSTSSSSGYGSSSPSGSGSSTSATSSTVTSRTVTVSGKSVAALTDAQGMTLYYYTPDTATTATCISACAKLWPPLLLSSGQPSAPGSLTGTLGVISSADGRQVVYNGHPLYTYSGDLKPGQTTGEGILGKWYVVKVGIAANAAGGGSSSGSSGGGY